jgi:hypothetical protein
VSRTGAERHAANAELKAQPAEQADGPRITDQGSGRPGRALGGGPAPAPPHPLLHAPSAPRRTVPQRHGCRTLMGLPITMPQPRCSAPAPAPPPTGLSGFRLAAAPSFGFAHFVPGPLEDPPEQETLVRFVINQQILDPRCRALIINT